MVDPADISLFNPGVNTPLLTKSKGYSVAEAALCGGARAGGKNTLMLCGTGRGDQTRALLW